MAGSKKYFHDRTVLLLLSINTFLVVFGALLVLLRLTGGHASGYIVQYRSNLGLSAFTPGGVSTFVGFIVFLFLVLAYHTLLGKRVYHIRRHFAFAVLGLGTLLILVATIVSNALLGIS